MNVAPLKVLMLGWDTPAESADTSAAPTPALVEALAPHAPLTLLLPHLSEPMHLPTLAHATGLSDLNPNDLQGYEQPHPESWQVPAAPYLGSSLEEGNDFQSPAFPYVGSAPVEWSAPTEALAAPDSTNDNDPAASTLLNPDGFASEAAEPETAEAHALSQPADDLTPDPEPTAAPAAPPTLPVHQSVLQVALASLRQEATDDAGLNFRVIQYARFATRTASHQDFTVVYAADWQAWLAGMEIRQRTGKPLVLHVHDLAADRTTSADRGWILELERLALRRADLVLTDSAELALRVLELYQLPPQRVRRLGRNAAQNPDELAHTIVSALQEVV